MFSHRDICDFILMMTDINHRIRTFYYVKQEKIVFKRLTPVSHTKHKPSPRLKCKSELFQLK